MPRYVVRQAPDDYHLYSTVGGDISGPQTRSQMYVVLRQYGMPGDAAEEMILEAESRPRQETQKLIASIAAMVKPRKVFDDENQGAA
jgi:hypothetical protein